MTTASGAAGIESDDFQSGSTLDSTWTHDVGTGSGTYSWWGQGTGDAGITLTIPATGLYDIWDSGINSSHIYQSCTDNDFTIEARFTDDAASGSTERGIFIADSTRANYCGVLWYGSSLYSGELSLGTSGQWLDSGPTVTDRRIRLVYDASASNVTAQYYNGTGWTDYGDSLTYGREGSLPWAAATVGVFCGNNTTGNADSADIDYFFEISAPVSPEDGLPASSRRVFIISG